MEKSGSTSTVNNETVAPKNGVDYVEVWAQDEDDRRDRWLQEQFNNAFGWPKHKLHPWEKPAQ